MRQSLFTVFHLNLGFSAIPPADVGRVLDHCVWPLLDATRHPGVRLGLELPARSLEAIAAADPLVLDAVRAAVRAERLEIVGSGLVQAILPLAPAAVAAHNLGRGREIYDRLLGAPPAIAYLHEQTYSAGLVRLYREAGYETIVAEWENPASLHGWPVACRARAAWVEGTGGARIRCLWNSSVVFQRVQRYAHGETELAELLAFLGAQGPGLLCLYGNDCEVFDYRPGAAAIRYPHPPGSEWHRLDVLLRTLAAGDETELLTPSRALALHPPEGPPLRLEHPTAPVPAKKQAKYNVTRWAVCGRDNVRLNARCHALARRLAVAEGLVRASGGRGRLAEGALARLADRVGELWGSDLRTHTTEERWADALARIGATAAALDRVVAEVEPVVVGAPVAPAEVVLVNPYPAAWNGWPVALDLHWPPGCVRGGLAVEAAGRPILAQAEEVEAYRDGSWRRARVVVAPIVAPYGTLRLRCASGPPPAPIPATTPPRLETAAATVELAPRRGATVQTMTFPGIAAGPLAGTVPLGTFRPIELAADWYTGGVVLFDAVGAKHTDLEPTTLVPLAAPADCPIRIPVAARVAGPWGELWKTVYVYRAVARVDVRWHLVLRDQRPRVLRLSALTLDPGAFAAADLRYATVDGGDDVEEFPLGATHVRHHEAVSPTVSARACLGATEGWVDVGDEQRGVTVAWDPAALAAVPLVQHAPADGQALTRLFLSLAESDDTAAALWRGHSEIVVSYLGRGGGLAALRPQAVAAARGLHVVRAAGR